MVNRFLCRIGAFLFVIVTIVGLAACGGGDDDVNVGPVAPVVATVPPLVADATFTQKTSAFLALPGETVRGTVLETSCKNMNPEGFCSEYVSMGEWVLRSSVELDAIKITTEAGVELAGFLRKQEDGVYRFLPNWHYNVWRKESFIVEVTVSPYAKKGQHTFLVVDIGTPSPDRTVEVKSANAGLEVIQIEAYAPMMVTASPGYQRVPSAKGDPAYLVYEVKVECGDPQNNCYVSFDFGQLAGLMPNSSIYVCYGTQCDSYTSVNSDGEVHLWVSLSPQFEGTVAAIMVVPDGSQEWYGLFVKEVHGWIGDKKIAPKLGTFDTPTTECTMVTPMLCKG